MLEWTCGLIVVLVLLALPAWGIWLTARLRRTEKVMDELRSEFILLQGALTRQGVAPPPSAAESAEETPEPASPEPAPAEPPPPEPAPRPPSSPELTPKPQWEPPPEPRPAATPDVPQQPPPQEPPPQEPPTPPPPSPPSPGVGVDLERWLGVRGAAVVGAVVLALAALYFLRYAVEAGWFPPVLRVAVAFAAGTGCLLASGRLREKGYQATGDALAGAGVVILYAATWAARVLYELIPMALAFLLMILVTLVCGLLAWRRRSQVIAVLGLMGGFATPLLLSTGQDRPLGLFSYILLLDIGLVILARRHRWPGLGFLALAATVLYQGLWIFLRMAPEELLLGLGILAVFALFFTFALPRDRHAEEGGGATTPWRLIRTAALLLPFGFMLFLTVQRSLTPDLWPLAGLLLLLSLAAAVLVALGENPLLATAAALADLMVVAAWMLRETWIHLGRVADAESYASQAWQLMAAVVALSLAFHGVREWRARRMGRPEAGNAPLPVLLAAHALIATGFLGLAILAAPAWPALDGWLAGLVPWLLTAGVPALLLTRQEHLEGDTLRGLLAATGLGIGTTLYFLGHTGPPGSLLLLAIATAVAVVFHLRAMIGRGGRPVAVRRRGDLASALPSLVLLVGLLMEADLGNHDALGPVAFGAVALLSGVLAALAASRRRTGGMLLGTLLLTQLVLFLRIDHAVPGAPESMLPDPTLPLFLLQLVAVAIFTFWPFLVGGGFARQPATVWTAALAAPAAYPALQLLWKQRWGDDALGLLAVGLALLPLAAVLLVLRRWREPEARRRALVWLSAVTLGLASLALPLQLAAESLTVAWALQALALVALWRWLDHPGLKYFALALAGLVSLRLVVTALDGVANLGGPPPVANLLAVVYLVPVVALLLTARGLAPREVERRRAFEEAVYQDDRPWGALLCTAAGVLLAFLWLNLTVFDAFGTPWGDRGAWSRLPARDLTLSLAWILWAAGLLAVGFLRRLPALRWTGLAFLMLTLGKVFLYDLGELEDLYRVASFVGLALSLLGVSLAYQRFSRMLDDEDGDEDGHEDREKAEHGQPPAALESSESPEGDS